MSINFDTKFDYMKGYDIVWWEREKCLRRVRIIKITEQVQHYDINNDIIMYKLLDIYT